MKPRNLNLWMPVLATALFTSCGSPREPLPPSLELPKPVSDLRAVRKGDKVYLAWTVPTETTDRQTVRYLGPTRVCRSIEDPIRDCGTPIGEVAAPERSTAKSGEGKSAAKIPASFIDVVPKDLQEKNPTGSLMYAVSVLNANGRSAGLSNTVQVPAAPTLPPPADFKAQVAADGVVLNWTGILEPHESPEVHHVYRLYRRQEGDAKDTAIADTPLTDSSQVQFVDRTFEWQKTYYYRVTVVTLVSQAGKGELHVEGDDSPTAKVFADDVFPPAVPSSLQAVASGVGQAPFVDLIWAPVTDADLAGYNVYRNEENGQPVKINSELVKTPAFRDTNVSPGNKYLYSVTAVDLRGNESARSEEASEIVPGVT
jgi:hypothetical protein